MIVKQLATYDEGWRPRGLAAATAPGAGAAVLTVEGAILVLEEVGGPPVGPRSAGRSRPCIAPARWTRRASGWTTTTASAHCLRSTPGTTTGRRSTPSAGCGRTSTPCRSRCAGAWSRGSTGWATCCPRSPPRQPDPRRPVVGQHRRRPLVDRSRRRLLRPRAGARLPRLFGGVPAELQAAYEAEWPLDAGFREREPLLQLYHLLVHVRLFGGGYHAALSERLDRLRW